MILNNSIKIKNYKCFGAVAQGFEKIYPINIIIGKNNSGKSSLLDLVECLATNKNPNEKFKGSEIEIFDVFTKDLLNIILSSTSNKEVVKNNLPFALNEKFSYNPFAIGDILQYPETSGSGVSEPIESTNLHQQIVDNSYNNLKIKEKLFQKIAAERDIKPEVSSTNTSTVSLTINGQHTTDLIRSIIHNRKDYDRRIVEVKLLEALNEITNPDILFKQIGVSYIDNNQWEITLLDISDNHILISEMGSGIKTVLLVLIHLIVIPESKNKNRSEYLFCFEELENNLHPAILKRLFNYIIKYSSNENCYFFITTHSSIAIDMFSKYDNAQILHVRKEDGFSTVETIANNTDAREVLSDLGIKASDVLLSNGVIWVEGPSDAIYLELFLDLYNTYNNDAALGSLNYTIQALATAIWKHSGFGDTKKIYKSTNEVNSAINLAQINHNHLLILDKDDNYDDRKPSEHANFANGTGKNKAKLIYESLKYQHLKEEDLLDNFGFAKNETLFFCITPGTFESYLEHFVTTKGKTCFEKYFDVPKNRGYFEKKRVGENYTISKVELAYNIVHHIKYEKLIFSDLAPEGSMLAKTIAALVNTIKKWN